MKFDILFLFLVSVSSQMIYISPDSSCYSGCSGLITNPYKNLWQALTSNAGNSNTEFVLLSSTTNAHFIMDHEVIAPGNVLTYTTSITMAGSVTIRPLFCTELIAIMN